MDYYYFKSTLAVLLRTEDVADLMPWYLLYIVIWNIIGDYCSLAATRVLLRWGLSYPTHLHLFTISDIVITSIFWPASVFVSFCIAMFGARIVAPQAEMLPVAGVVERAFFVTQHIVETVAFSTPADFSTSDSTASADFHVLIYASLVTSYLTCLWLILALIFTPIVRVLVWSRTTGLTAIGRVLDAEHKPMVALGYATALVILATGGIVWGVGRVVSGS